MSDQVNLTPEEEQMCNELAHRNSDAGSWCWVDGRGERFNGFGSPRDALLHAKKNNAIPQINISPLKTKI